MPKYGRKDELRLRTKDDSVQVVTGKRYGWFFVHKEPGGNHYAVTHIASGIAAVPGIKGAERAKKMAHVIVSHDIPASVPYARDRDELLLAVAENAKLLSVLKEFNTNAGDPLYDPMQRVVKEIQTSIFDVIEEKKRG